MSDPDEASLTEAVVDLLAENDRLRAQVEDWQAELDHYLETLDADHIHELIRLALARYPEGDPG